MPQALRLAPENLAAELQGGVLPAYLVSGHEPLLVAEAADAIRVRARELGFTEREVHFIERAGDWEDVRAAAASRSLFGSRRLLEIRIPSAKPGAGAKLCAELLARPDPDTVLLILAPQLEREAADSEWVRAIEGKGAWLRVWPLDPSRLPGWLAGRARRLKLELAPDALELLLDRTEGNLLAAHQELEKLALLAPPGRLSADTVLASVADSARFDVFQLGEASLTGDAERALRVLNALKSEGTEPALVLWALTKATRDLWTALQSGGPIRGRGPSRQSAALERAMRRAPRLSFGALVRRAARADRMVKGREPGDAWDQMALLAAELAGIAALPDLGGMLK